MAAIQHRFCQGDGFSKFTVNKVVVQRSQLLLYFTAPPRTVKTGDPDAELP